MRARARPLSIQLVIYRASARRMEPRTMDAGLGQKILPLERNVGAVRAGEKGMTLGKGKVPKRPGFAESVADTGGQAGDLQGCPISEKPIQHCRTSRGCC